MIAYQGARCEKNCRRNVSKVSAAITEGLKVEREKPGPKISDTDVTNPPLANSEKKERQRNKQAAEGWSEVAKSYLVKVTRCIVVIG